MALGNYHDVRGPERARVMIGKHIVCFAHDAHLSSATQNFIAVKIVRHCREILRFFPA